MAEIRKSPPKVPHFPTVQKKYQHSLIEVVLLIVVIGLFLWFIVQPKKAELASQNEILSELQQEEAELSSNLTKLENLVEKLKANPKAVSQLDEALPLTNNTTRIHLLLEELASASGIVIGDINVIGENDAVVAGDTELLADPFAASRTLKVFNTGISLIGTYEQLVSFMQKIENNARIMEIVSLEFAGTDEGFLDLKLTLDIYYFAP